MGPNARAVAVIDPSFSNAELKRMHELGVRGIRINLASETVVNTIEMIEPLSKQVNELGWHVQFWMMADTIKDIENLLMRLPSPLVFDHLGHLPQPAGLNHPAFRVISNLINKGKTWVKLSAAYTDSKIGPPTYADATKVAQAYLKLAPERMVWGSNWPHPSLYSARKPMVDDALLFDLLGVWAPEEALRKRILVDNPAALYDYPK
jgi:predicted TIM-barrel fold metal-dependent hydrolase